MNLPISPLFIAYQTSPTFGVAYDKNGEVYFVTIANRKATAPVPTNLESTLVALSQEWFKDTLEFDQRVDGWLQLVAAALPPKLAKEVRKLLRNMQADECFAFPPDAEFIAWLMKLSAAVR